jgi:hypothetical protein
MFDDEGFVYEQEPIKKEDTCKGEFWGNIDDLVVALHPVLFLTAGLLFFVPVLVFADSDYKEIATNLASACVGAASMSAKGRK